MLNTIRRAASAGSDHCRARRAHPARDASAGPNPRPTCAGNASATRDTCARTGGDDAGIGQWSQGRARARGDVRSRKPVRPRGGMARRRLGREGDTRHPRHHVDGYVVHPHRQALRAIEAEAGGPGRSLDILESAIRGWASVAQCPAQRQRQCSLPGADGAADANAQGMIGVQRSVFMAVTYALPERRRAPRSILSTALTVP